jgi:hypothetical protein
MLPYSPHVVIDNVNGFGLYLKTFIKYLQGFFLKKKKKSHLLGSKLSS